MQVCPFCVGDHANFQSIPPDLDPGEKSSLLELQKMASDDSALRNMTREQKDDICNKLVEYRTHKATSSRANNIAASQDMVRTSDNLIREASTAHITTHSMHLQ